MARSLSALAHTAQPLDAVLGSPGMIRVLRVLVRHGGQLPVARLVRDTRLSLPGTLKVLGALEALGVVRVVGSGRARLYDAVAAHPVVGMLEALFQSEAGYREQVIQAVKAAGDGLDLAALWMVGSTARLDDRPSSDIDILMVSIAPDPSSRQNAAEILRTCLAGDAVLTGLRPSVIALTMSDIGSLIVQEHLVWVTAKRDAKVLAGRTPQALELDALGMERVR